MTASREFHAPLSASRAFELASELHRQGRLPEALAFYRCTLSRAPDHLGALCGIGIIKGLQGQIDDGLAELRRAARVARRSAHAQANLGLILDSFGRREDAIDRYRAALAINPAHVAVHYNLANICQELGRDTEALQHYAKAIELKPEFAEAHNNRANLLQALGRPGEAVAGYRTAIALKPGYLDAHRNLGNAYLALDRNEEAILAFEQALAIDPANAAVHNDLASAHLVLGDLRIAHDHYQMAVELAPANPVFQLNFAILKPFTADDPRLATLERLAEDTSMLKEKDQIALQFALSKVHADLNDSARSFSHLLAGNRLKRRQVVYDDAMTLASFAQLRAIFTRERMQAYCGCGDPSPVPVFIVGMPRSGTTLLEQILASHSRAFGACEIDDFSQALSRLTGAVDAPLEFADIVAVLSPQAVRQLGRQYVEGIRAKAPEACRIINKMPANFAYVGLIHLALPKARIIHISRDPVDNFLSCFSILFKGDPPHTYDLAELGRYYRAYAELMAHWRAVLPAGVMLDIRYEDVVADLEGQARLLLVHCGLAFEDQCLAFHATRRPVSTASLAQVRRPIYRSSVGRWRPYRDQLQPLLDALRIDADQYNPESIAAVTMDAFARRAS
jgi:tetratricopeptide (TPR) repeat protein